MVRAIAAGVAVCVLFAATHAVPAEQQQQQQQPAAANKVQVFLMMGQSNMLGEGKIGVPGKAAINGTLEYAVTVEHKYPYLWDAATSNWTVSKTVRNVFVMGSGPQATPGVGLVQTNNWMTGGEGHRGSIGPELGIGHALEAHAPTAPAMALKSCIGNRALGWDLLPPGTKSWDWCVWPLEPSSQHQPLIITD